MRLFEPESNSFESLVDQFKWDVPEYFNIAEVICSRHARNASTANDTALICVSESDPLNQSICTFRDLERLSNRLANLLSQQGCKPGDRVAIVLPQQLETALAHIAAHKLGAVSLPLAVLFGIDALLHRLSDSCATIVIADQQHLDNLLALSQQLPSLRTVIVCGDQPLVEADTRKLSSGVGESPVAVKNFWQEIERLPVEAEQFDPVKTKANDPACLIYTSGTTGLAKGALLAHRSILGNLPGFELSLEFFPYANDVFFTPADWAWTGGLYDGLFPTLFYGKPIIGYRYRKFDPEDVLALLQRHQVTCGFFPPTALKMLRTVDGIEHEYDLALRAIMSGGETLGTELISWAKRSLGVSLNEMYGQTEHNFMVGNCSKIAAVKSGSMGRPYPGHRVEIMRADGRFASPGEEGELVAHAQDAVHFLGYWQQPDATQEKYTGEWFHTGDVGFKDEDGYIWFAGRKDDVISSSGYRIGPGEIEDCILKHPAIAQVAVIGVPDPDGLRGDIIKAFIVLREGITASDSLSDEIKLSVREQLSAHEYPREIEFIDALPLTVTGKVRRVELRALSQRKL